ncbi:putative heterokaryon incompatibility protein [Paramyrothecium foliicola]|nr:putative heterokaryon incompatibility protein [Paramyrothecium foliicola]
MDGTRNLSYPGSKLDGKSSFRIVDLQPGQGDDTVTLHLINSTLDHTPPFEALSYAWGDVLQTESVKVVSTSPDSACYQIDSLLVTKNCAAALKRLRLAQGSRLLWIDAICIDQSSVPERNKQLALMPKIYRKARHVIIYLGESSGAFCSDAVMDWVRKTHEPATCETQPFKPDWLAFQTFLERPWFKRVWVLQELQAARTAIVLCGDRQVKWRAFRELKNDIDNGQSPIKTPLPYTLQSLLFGKPRHHSVELSFAARLLRELQRTRRLGASDARDKLYAILPLLHPGSNEENHDEVPSIESHSNVQGFLHSCGGYSQSASDVFTQLAQSLVEALGLEVLRNVATPNSIPDLPSWVPDWSIDSLRSFRGMSLPISRDDRRRFQFSFEASLGLPGISARQNQDHRKPWRFSKCVAGDGQQITKLQIQTANIATITKIGQVCNIYEGAFPLQQWMSLCEPAHLQLDGSEPLKLEDPSKSLSQFTKAVFGPSFRRNSVAASAITRLLDYEKRAVDDGPKAKELLKIFAHLAPSDRTQSEELFRTCHGRRFFVTDMGCLGLAPVAAMIGDQVTRIEGLKVPFVTRSAVSSGDKLPPLRLVGECHVDADMAQVMEYRRVVVY